MIQPTDSVPALLALLQVEREQLLAQFAAIPVEQRALADGAGGWSAVQIIEHVARVEGNVARMIAKGAELPQTATSEERQAGLLTATRIRWVRERTTKVDAPERVRPAVGLTPDDALAQLHASRAAVLEAFTAADPAVLDGIIFPHPFIGPLTLRAWVELVAHHDARHAEQMAELLRA
jgi:uncharacterized damage-inducible protein DinB